MIHILSTVCTSQEFALARTVPQSHPIGADPAATCPHRVGEMAFVALRDGVVVARALAQPMDAYPGIGNIALFECIDDPATAKALLEACEGHLRSLGIHAAIGPMDGDTWHGYRTSDPSNHEPFLLDRRTTPWMGALFRTAGYQVCDRYVSSWIAREHLSWSRLEPHLQRLQRKGIRIRPLELQDWEAEMSRLHGLSLEAFAGNSWYSALDLDSFRSLYDPWRHRLPTDGILLATQAGRLLAYAVSCPDQLTDGSCRTIVKTVATSAHPSARGSGTLLVEWIHRKAFQDGHSGAIHALMHRDNPSSRILSEQGRDLGTYSLWRKDLA